MRVPRAARIALPVWGTLLYPPYKDMSLIQSTAEYITEVSGTGTSHECYNCTEDMLQRCNDVIWSSSRLVLDIWGLVQSLCSCYSSVRAYPSTITFDKMRVSSLLIPKERLLDSCQCIHPRLAAKQ